MSKPQLLSGARAKLQVNGQTIAFVTDVSVDVSHNVRALHAFGSPAARSVEPLSANPVTVTLGTVVPVNDSTGKAIDSSAENMGIAPVIQQMLLAEDITVTLVDKITGKTYASVRNCRFQSRSLSLSAQALANTRITLMGIYDKGDDINSPGQLGF